MRGLFRSPLLRWSAIFLILSVSAAQQGRSLWMQRAQAAQALEKARERSRSLDDEIARLKRLVGSVPRPDSASAPIEERLAHLVVWLRKAEPMTRVSIQTLALEGGASSDRHAANAMLQPLAGFPEAGAVGLTVDGTYLTRAAFEEFLAAGRDAGASLTALNVLERRFQATFRLYGRL